MKTALYIEDGLLQVVLTPETEPEKAILRLVENKETTRLYRGSFYSCRGGWVRQRDLPCGGNWYQSGHEDDNSLILVLENPKPPAEPVSPVYSPFAPPTP